MTKLAKVGTTLDMSINQVTLFDIHVTFLTFRMYENYVVPLQRRARKSRQATKGVGLHKTIQSMGIRMHISIVKGNRRPQDPLQAAKFASEAGVVVRHQIPCLTHWKYYKKLCGEANCMYGYSLLTFNSVLSNFNGFTFHSHYYVQSRLDIDKAHPPTQEACWNVL